jgi:hypothetical protein
MNKILLIPLTAVILILLGGSYWVSRNRDSVEMAQLNTETSLYTNEAYAYSVEYPADLQVQEYGDESVTFGRIDGEMVDGQADVRILTFESEPGQSFQEVAGVQLMNLCAADGPNETFSCTDVTSVTEFQSASGVSGFEFRLRGERLNFTSNEVTEDPRGPFYVFPLDTSATASQVLVVMPPMNKDSMDVSEAIMTDIATSLRRTE